MVGRCASGVLIGLVYKGDLRDGSFASPGMPYQVLAMLLTALLVLATLVKVTPTAAAAGTPTLTVAGVRVGGLDSAGDVQGRSH